MYVCMYTYIHTYVRRKAWTNTLYIYIYIYIYTVHQISRELAHVCKTASMHPRAHANAHTCTCGRGCEVFFWACVRIFMLYIYIYIYILYIYIYIYILQNKTKQNKTSKQKKNSPDHHFYLFDIRFGMMLARTEAYVSVNGHRRHTEAHTNGHTSTTPVSAPREKP